MPVTAVYDANVLYPAPLRDLLIRVAQAGLLSKTAEELLATLEGQGPTEAVARLRQLIDLL